jgi:hypothetical protein
MGIRLNFVVEGQTEETFVNTVLGPHLAERCVWTSARCVLTSRRRGVKYRGGFRTYNQPRNDILSWIKEDQNEDARFTTFFDLYGLPSDFPGYQEALRTSDPYEKVRVLEQALGEDIADPRFIPHLQLHEFETLLLSDPLQLEEQFPGQTRQVQRLAVMATSFGNPELIDQGETTAPSKRIITEIPEYQGMKQSAGPLVARKIGIVKLRTNCRHFGEWICQLESLGRVER